MFSKSQLGEPFPREEHHPRVDLTTLTPREKEAALLVAEGLENKEIARRMELSPRTVEIHIKNLLTKIGLTRRRLIYAMAKWGYDEGED